MTSASAVPVYCYPVDRNSAYVPLLFTGIEDRYRPIYRHDGARRDALDDFDARRDAVVHVHWEEFVLRACESEAQADAAAAAFATWIADIRELGGPLVWTVHNEVPHSIPYRAQALAMRAILAKHADAILVHDVAAVDVLATQVALDRARVRVLAHPSYLDRHEDERTLLEGLTRPYDRRIQAFGWIRLQKGYDAMVRSLPAAWLRARGAHIRISGSGDEADAVAAGLAGRTDVDWDVRHVPDGEVPSLLRSAACVVLPYERVLTSGVAILAMSVGAMLVGVDVPHVRELVPPGNRRFLYARDDEGGLRRVVDDVLVLSDRERRDIVAANLAVARERRPSIVARRLAAIYDDVRASRRDRPDADGR